MLSLSDITARNLSEILEDKDITNIEYGSNGYPSLITYSNGYKVELYYSTGKLIQAKYLDDFGTLIYNVHISYEGERISSVSVS